MSSFELDLDFVSFLGSQASCCSMNFCREVAWTIVQERTKCITSTTVSIFPLSEK